MNGFQMQVLAYDPYPVKGLEAEYVSVEELMSKSDVISLHCPLTTATKHIINKDTIAMMKEGVYLINTSRGSLIDTEALIGGLLEKKFAGARLVTFPNVLITSHMGFFTTEAMQAIAIETLENAYALENGLPLVNRVGIEAS